MDLDDLKIIDRLQEKYFEEWRHAATSEWAKIQAKLDMLVDFRSEIRSIANQGVDDDG